MGMKISPPSTIRRDYWGPEMRTATAILTTAWIIIGAALLYAVVQAL